MGASPAYEISTDRARLDVGIIHDFLRTSYWSPGIARDVVERSIANSLCFGAYATATGQQVGFARVVTDFATFAWLADVFVLPAHRGRGVAKLLIQAVRAHDDLQGLRRFVLATRDSHALYAPFGFAPLPHPERFMMIRSPDGRG